MKEKIAVWLERILIADVFLVIIAFAWFALALIGKSAGVSLGWDIWYRLWQPVFNPAIGILFTGALVSWLIKKWNQRFNNK